MKNIVSLAIIVLSFFSVKMSGASDSLDAYKRFVHALDDEQKVKLVLPFDDGSRGFWSYLPGAMMPRPGIRMDKLSDVQRELVFQMLEESLSPSGYDEVLQIIDLECVLADLGGDSEFRDPLKYYVIFYGNPIIDSVWSWSFQGHHLVLNFTYVNRTMSYSPRFLGASPAHIHEGEKSGQRTLAGESDRAFELMMALNPEQRKKVTIRNEAYLDIVTGTAMEVSPLDKKGLTTTEMDSSQVKIFRELIFEYLDILPMHIAAARMERIEESGFENISFSWAGPIENTKPFYYRIQGDTFLIEFDCTFGDVNHVHTVWRDFSGDFGRDLLAEHMRLHHQK